MKLREYENWVEEKARFPINDINYSFVGLAGETGEALEWHKKVNLRGDTKFADIEALRSELGDILHYIVRIASYYGFSVKDLIRDNVEKIEKRQLKGAKDA